MMKRFSFITIFCIPLFALSQRMLTLDEAIATALQNNFDIRLSKNDSVIAAIDYSYRNGAFVPRLNANLGTVWNNNAQRQVLSDGSVKESGGLKSNSITAQLALNWTLFDGLKMFITRNKTAEVLKLGELEIKNQVINTVATVVGNYYNIVRQKQQLKAVEEQMSINEERVKLAQYKLDIGAGAKPDVLQSKIDLNAQKAAQIEQQKLIAQLKEQLNQAMSIKLNTPYEVSDSIPLNTGIVLMDIQNGAQTANPSLLIAKKNIDIAGFTLRERKADQYPIVSFNSAYNFNRLDNTAVLNSFSTLFNRTKGFNYGLTATIPILNNFTTRKLIKKAQWDVQYQHLAYDNQQSVIDLNIITAYLEYEQEKKSLDLEESNILLAQENVSIILQTYKLGAATYIELREAQKSLEDAYNRLIAARYNTKIAETELLRLKGDLVK